MLHNICMIITLGVPPGHSSPHSLMPEVKTWYSVETDIFVSPWRTFQTAVDSLTPLVAHSTQGTRSFRYVMVEQIYSYVLFIPQVGRGQVSHAGSLLIVVCHNIIHVHIRVSELFKRPVIYSKHRVTNQVICGIFLQDYFKYCRYRYDTRNCITCSERISIDDSRQESPKSSNGKAANESP